MNREEYIKQRLDDQIEWYDQKSMWNQKIFKRLKLIEFTAAAMIPFLIGFMTQDAIFLQAVVGLLGVLISVITAMVTMNKYHENWIEYRTTCETLRHEKYLFETNVPPYDTKAPFPLLVARVEAMISKENSQWAATLRKAGPPADDSPQNKD
ncbi:MAG: DUF4231 domain-containing protein [Desulfobacter sp.]|nr:MAG: DUF4231 domain-containing protein [Desulfobacter sp.]